MAPGISTLTYILTYLDLHVVPLVVFLFIQHDGRRSVNSVECRVCFIAAQRLDTRCATLSVHCRYFETVLVQPHSPSCYSPCRRLLRNTLCSAMVLLLLQTVFYLFCIYTVSQKNWATFIFTITLANVDRFQ